MRVDIVTKEFPPEIYGGAGVHVAELAKALAPLVELKIRAFGAPRDGEYHGAEVFTYQEPPALEKGNGALRTLGTDLEIVRDLGESELIHSHTWYANFAGLVAGMLYGTPHVITAHSLEPLRPWKAEQLGGGYALSSWIELSAYEKAQAIIAVSEGMRKDILRSYPSVDPHKVHVVHNGIDVEAWQPVLAPETVRSLGVDPDRPIVLWVGRITRQKGVSHLLRASVELPRDAQLVLCAGAPDTPELAAEVQELIVQARAARGDENVIVIERMLPRDELQALLSAATVFACPSIYEPLGIVNLEAMACGTAVVATETGGIPEVVEHGKTGVLVPITPGEDGTGEPADPQQFASDFAQALSAVLADPDEARQMGEQGRKRAASEFDWTSIAEKTVEIYRTVVEAK